MLKNPVRKNFLFSKTETAWLAQLALASEVSEAHVVRELVRYAARKAGLPETQRPTLGAEQFIRNAQSQ